MFKSGREGGNTENKNVVNILKGRYKGGRYIRNGGFQEQSHGVESGG